METGYIILAVIAVAIIVGGVFIFRRDTKQDSGHQPTKGYGGGGGRNHNERQDHH
ncbi:hypothetical protein [uncultured Sulfitobacter sp.]|uniref:hypothetical protein n=1 Tax=uncultured Sulfitobacter sp. TaxID=191468 RepID=UPI0025933C14|nr:hypothetical protein [uncultured Sulfitobacter sp.]